MYCPVYGCSSDSRNNTDGLLHFFEFPKPIKGPVEKKCRDVWIEFCKRRGFMTTKCTCICSLQAYVLSHLPEFLKSIKFPGKRKLKLKDDAVPTENKPLQVAAKEGPNTSKRRSTGALSRRRVSQRCCMLLFCLNLKPWVARKRQLISSKYFCLTRKFNKTYNAVTRNP